LGDRISDGGEGPVPASPRPARGQGRALRALLFGLLVTSVDFAGPVLSQAAASGGTVVLTGTASAGVQGGEFYDTARLAGGSNPTGTVTFRVFGPDDPTCSRAPIRTSVNPVTGTTDPRTATSDHFVLSAPGTYHFVATYSGDANNAPAGPTACADPDQTIGFGGSSFSFSARSSDGAAVGRPISDRADLATSSNPTGTLTFSLFGPDQAGCAGSPIFRSTKPVNGNGAYVSDPFTPTAPGAYHWVASYSGDADNASAATPCDDPAQQVVVTGATTTSSTTTSTSTTSTSTTSTTSTTVPAAVTGRCAELGRTRTRFDQQVDAFQRTLGRKGDPRIAALVDRVRAQVDTHFDQALAACRAPGGPPAT